MSDRSQTEHQSIAEAFRSVIHDVQDLVRAEVRLAKAEVQEKVGSCENGRRPDRRRRRRWPLRWNEPPRGVHRRARRCHARLGPQYSSIEIATPPPAKSVTANAEGSAPWP
jgi:hypothetical protein